MPARSFPNPEPHRGITDPDLAGTVRRLHCKLYNFCGSVALRENWSGWHCNKCHCYRPIGAEQGLLDAVRLQTLVAEAWARLHAWNAKQRRYTTRKGA